MANYARLLNTDSPISDLGSLVDAEGRPTVDHVETTGPGYHLPIPWLCFFRPDDMRPVSVLTEDLDGNVERISVKLPCTTVEQAIGNLEQALPLFEKIVGDHALALSYWENAMSYLRGLPLAYLTFDPLEIIMMTGPLTKSEELVDALSGTDAAIPYLIDYAPYEEGCLPYPREVMMAPPSNYDQRRMGNAVSLDVYADCSSWYRVGDAA